MLGFIGTMTLVSGIASARIDLKPAPAPLEQFTSDTHNLEDVPWSMYFHESFALHGAYWHDRFGLRHSHGCVNLAPQDAQW